MDRDVLMHQLRERFEAEFTKAMEAAERAPDGHWIDGCEMEFRDAGLTLAREGLELAVQAKIDAESMAHAATFSPSGPGDQRPPPGAQ